MSPDRRYEILVNSTDTFDDCWAPFFTLFATYWSGWRGRVLLNTERKGFSHPDVDVHPACTGARDAGGKQLPWAECLHRGLDQVRAPYVLYFQEDYLLEAPVLVDRVDEVAALMDDRGLGCVRLAETPNSGPWRPTDHPMLWEVRPESSYLLSMTAGLWRTDFLRSCIRRHENPWQHEILGTRRLRRRGARIHSVNRDRHSWETGQPILPYRPTGIKLGRWVEDIVVDLFERHGIEVDLTRRGFYADDAGGVDRGPLLQRAIGRLRSL